MSREKRIILFIISFLILVVIVFTSNYFSSLDYVAKIILFSTLLMLSFTTFLLEHFFTTPSNVLASSISIILLLAPLKMELNEFGIWYWIYFIYALLIFFIALFALLLLDSSQSNLSRKNRLSFNLKRIAIFWGNGRFLFTSLFFMALIFYVDNQSFLFIMLSFYAALVILIDPKKFTLQVFKKRVVEKYDIGEIIGVQSRNTFIAKLLKNHSPVHRFDLVEFNYSMIEKEQIMTGMIIDNYFLNEQQWIKILSLPEIRKIIASKSNLNQHESNIVYKINLSEEPIELKNFVGIVIENSNINKIKFEYAEKVLIQEGNLLEITIKKTKILYQIIEGVTDIEILESKNKAGKIIGEAVQLGVWNDDRLRFEKYGWVPEMNTPIFLASAIEKLQLKTNNLILGNIPDTNYPLIFDVNEAVSHHLAILGVTGTGKSVFCRNLVKEIIKNNTKVICVDFTNEYKSRLSEDEYINIIGSEIQEKLFDAIDKLSEELAKFPNQQNRELIDTQKKILMDKFKESIDGFIQSEKNISIFELPDVENTTNILEYTRYFFKALFILARSGNFKNNKICVVLEEAHTVIPEWNFIGVEDRKAQSLVNAIGQIALQGRKYNIGFIVIAQRTANVSKTVLTQCNSIIAFQQFDKTSCDFLSNYMDKKMVSSLSSLKFRQACAVGRAFKSGVPIIFEVPIIEEKIYKKES
ncbi:MAG TPA: DUF87 domain-containing protein [Atribacterota bacterium]|nr:DUF87 domain-containing protein [Atribacterota bacterium]